MANTIKPFKLMKLALNNLYDFPFVCINVEDHNGISEDVLNMNLGT